MDYYWRLTGAIQGQSGSTNKMNWVTLKSEIQVGFSWFSILWESYVKSVHANNILF